MAVLAGLLAVLLVFGAHLFIAPKADAELTVEITATEMTFVKRSDPDKNFGYYPTLQVSSDEYRTLLAFDTSTIDPSSTIVSAELEVAVTSSAATKAGMDVRAVSTGWDGKKVTYATRPAQGSVSLNPSESQVAKPNASLTTKLTALDDSKPADAVGLQLAYTQSGTPVQLSKTTKPILRLRISSATDNSSVAPNQAGNADAPVTDQSYDLKPTAMTYTSAGNPDSNYSPYGYMAISKGAYRGWLMFDTASIPSSKSVVSASLELTTLKSSATAPALDIRSTAATWSANTLTAGNAPVPGETQLNSTDANIATTGKSQTSPIKGLARTRAGGKISLQLGYSQNGVLVQLSKTPTPVLHLVVRDTNLLAASDAADTPLPGSSSIPLPFTTSKSGSAEKKVFAHYFPPFPISIDNVPSASDYYTRNYLQPSGENGKYASVGGLLRDRPLPRDPLGGDYLYTDAVTEVREASTAGLDGFLANILGWGTPSWDGSLRVVKAASELNNGFVVVPNIDMSSDAANASVQTMASYLKTFYAERGAYRMPDGRYMLTVFKAEAKPASFYKSLEDELHDTYGINVNFIGVFLSLSDAQIDSYAPVSYGMATWGPRTAALTNSYPNRAATVHAKGLKWMSPISVQDVRHKTLSFAESGNTELLRASWDKAIADDADMAQMVTWNDFSESTGFSPSVAHGDAFLDLNSYYLTKFKRGSTPPLGSDELVVTHRIQSVKAQPKKITAKMDPTLGGAKTTPRDTVEVVCLCKAAATVSLTVGGKTTSFDAKAGVSAFTVPLTPGTVSATATRSGKTVAQATSTHRVVSSTDWWDLQYYAATSRG